MTSNVWSLYLLMLKSRLLEEAIAQLWHGGLISGEMHLGSGEEGIIAGVISHLRKSTQWLSKEQGTVLCSYLPTLKALIYKGFRPLSGMHQKRTESAFRRTSISDKKWLL